MSALFGVRRQEHIARRVAPGRWERGAELFLGDARHELVRQRREDPGAIPRVRLCARRPAVRHAAAHPVRVAQNLVAPFTAHVRHETHAARVVLERRIVEPRRAGRCGRESQARDLGSMTHRVNARRSVFGRALELACLASIADC